MMQQGLHHQQQQQHQHLAALLSIALPKEDTSTATASAPSAAAAAATITAAKSSSSSTSSITQEVNESNRLSAIDSLHRFILYPPNSVLVAQAATFLAQGFSRLLSDKSYPVQRSAAAAYGALCSVLCSIPLGSNGRQNHVIVRTLVDRFIAWAVPSLNNVSTSDRSTELALASLREFLTVGDVGSIDTYAFSILKACKELLDDERMSLGLLNDLLGVLTTISLRFFRHFHPHFVDIVDLLLGWAMVPDLADSGRQVIMGSFLQFQKHWVSNLQLPLGLLLKFQGDMDALLQDGTPGSPQQFQRLLTLLSCFSTVLQSTASGLLEINLLEQIVEPLNKMIIKILGCLSMIGKKYGWSKWIEHSWRCLTLLAEILGEKFASFYAFSIDMLFHSLDLDDSIPYEGGKITSIQIHGVLKTNLQLLSLQKLGLLPSSVPKILQFDAPISQLRLHPNHLVVASSAATYVFLLQHGNDEVVEQSMTCLIEELTSLKGMIQKVISHEGLKIHNSLKVFLSKDEFFALVKFDLKVLLSCIFLVKDGNLVSHPDKAHLCLSRVEKLYTFITSVLNPFDLQIQSCVELQVNVMEMLSRLSSVELLTKLSIQRHADGRDNMEKKDDLSMNEDGVHYRHSVIMVDHLRKYSQFLVKSLNCSSPLSIKVKGLDWIHQFCMDVMTICEDFVGEATLYEELRHNDTVHTLVFSVMDAASDREPQVRSRTARVFPLLLQAKIIGPPHLYGMAEVVFERLSDPDNGIRSEFVGLLSYVLPMTFYLCGPLDNQTATAGRSTFRSFGNGANLRLMNVFALKELNRRLNPQQFVSVLNYISQRWKVPLSTWIQRLICRCQNSKELVQGPVEETGNFGCNGLWSWIQVDDDILQKTSSVNNLAGIWWAIHEAARYCTSARLRTNLGGPSQTFAALERMLMDAAHVLELDVGQSDGSLSMASSSGAHILPMRLLLDFVEALKKNVYNAYDGSSVLPCVSRQSSLFFRANKKVCEDWFSRICEPMMNAALALHCYDAATHYCSLRLQELRISISSSLKDKSWGHVVDNSHNTTGRLAEDVLRIVQYISLALCRRHEPEALIGLQKWVSLNFSSVFVEEKSMLGGHGPFSWIHGLVYQAKGQYEKSAALFTHLLQSEESLSSMGADGVQFVIARVIESYTAICDWKSLESWLSELQALRAKHAGKSYSGALTTAGNEMNAIHALAHFDERDLQASWASLDLTPKSSCELTLDPKLALQRSEQMLLQAMLYHAEGKVENVLLGTQKAKSMLDEVLTVLPLDGLEEASPLAIQLNCIIALEEGCKIDGSQDRLNQFHSLLNSFLHEGTYLLSPSRQDCNAWMKIFRVYQYVLPTSLATLQLCKNLMSLARKQRNLGLANRLHSYLKDHVHGCSEQSYQKFLLTSLGYEEILLMYAENKIVDAYVNMWSFIRSGMLCLETVDSTVEHGFLKAKACLKLIDWLRQDYPDVRLEEVLSTIYNELNKVDGAYELSMMDVLVSGPSMHLITEKIAGAAAKLSTRLCPTWGKSWISYASWCFNLAKDALISSHEANILSSSLSPIFVSELPPVRLNLTADEVSGVESMVLQSLRKNCSSKYLIEENGQNLWYESSEDLTNRSSVKSMVRKVVDVIEAAAGAPGAENFSGESLSATVASQLRMVFQEHIDVQIEESFLLSSLNDLLEIWWSLRKKRVSLFGHAAFGFMQFLSYSTSRCDIGPSTSSNHRAFCKKSGSLTLRAALYILHILLNYGAELRDALEPYLFTVPLLAWQDIIPQLFARLSSHPEHVIRKQLEGLLMMLAKLTPWSIVYPTLVDINSHDEEPAEELQHILDGLLKLYPRLVQDVQLMIRELDNVTVLWEELWLSTIQDLQGDVMRRINLLKEEAARIAQNVTLDRTEKRTINAAKYSAMMAPIVVALDRRLALISREPVTPHERWFQEEYKEQLKSAILAFKTPPACAAALEDIWQPFDRLAASLASYQRKCSVSVEEVAPQLAHLSSSDIPMPGFEKQAMLSESDGGLTTTSQGIITISSFSNEVAILPTKTKPKKLVMLGSDGEKYMYLLKGREDLRLDARIMQLLQAVNDFLHSSADTRRCSVSIRYYSVTPISGRAGLIQWVDNVTSIYSVFKAWQQRVRFAQLSATGGGNSKGTVPPPVPRPSDMFYGKIIPALKEKGIKRVISRRDWPHDVKRKVLLDLMKETPRQLLHQELWCASAGFKAFNSKLKRFSGSLAAMSMIGHILGLGDRHLDNILLDFFTGDIVHIDYNVCFDKGQRLKVPEIVPFRLTQTLEATLGLTGVEGVFRANCEAVIGVLRKNKDILLMLLEVFVWDPLVEWTRGDFHDDAALGGEERKGMELAVSLSLFASRVQEIRVSLQENHDLLLAAVPAVESSLEKFLDVLNQYQVVSARFFHADQERSTLLRHETSAMSLVADATSKSEKLRALYEIQAHEFSQAKVAVTEKAQEAATWVEKHGRILDALQRGLIPDVQAGMKLSGVGDGLSLTSAVSVSGVPLTIIPEPTQAKCRDIDREMSQLVSELDHSVSCAVATLQTYSLALQRILPLNYLMQSPMHGWAQTLQLAISTLSSDVLAHARRQAGDLIAKAHTNNQESIRQNHEDLCLRVEEYEQEEYEQEIEKLEKGYAELLNSIGLEAESNVKDHLLSAFMKYMQSASLESQGEPDANKEKVLCLLYAAVSHLYVEVKDKLLNILKDFSAVGKISSTPPGFRGLSSELEHQIEKCIVLSEFVMDMRRLLGNGTPVADAGVDHLIGNWASNFKAAVVSCKDIVVKMTDSVLPEVIKCIVSSNSEVMDALGALTHIRESVKITLEQLVDVELERESLLELETGYFLKVGLITEQQLALEEAAVKGRDHLSWEEAEELASQEEACRAQLDQLHQSWNQKDMRSSSLTKKEASIKSALVSSQLHFLSLFNSQEVKGLHGISSTALLRALAKPFSDLESIETVFLAHDIPLHSSDIQHLANFLGSGSQIAEYILHFKGLLGGHSFFIWKVGVMELFLDTVVQHASLFIDQNVGFDQLVDILKKKLISQLQELIGHFLIQEIASTLLGRLEKETEYLKRHLEVKMEHGLDPVEKEAAAVKKVQMMLEEYCNAHETLGAARSAVCLVREQVNDLKEAIQRTCVEIVQMEWMHDVTLTPSHNRRPISRKFLENNDKTAQLLSINRSKLLDSMQSFISKLARSVESLQALERTSITAEGQLERSMNWACGAPTLSSAGGGPQSSRIPPEFHEHLRNRKRLLQEAREKAADIMNICLGILEFEASRDGILCIPGGEMILTGRNDGAWQQAFLNVLTRLDVTFHAFSRAEQEWKLAQSNVEAASSDLFSATNELCIASVKAKSASGDLQSTLLQMRDCAYETSVALSAFSRVAKSHTALTSECGSMLEEVLAITEDLHDVHNLAKEAASVHLSLTKVLSQGCEILLPLESLLLTDVPTMTDAMARERETKVEISPIHGQAIYQSYHPRIWEAFQSFRPLVPLLMSSVKELHSMLIGLAQTSTLHAGNLHKALEGLGDASEARSQEIIVSRKNIVDIYPEYDNATGAILSTCPGGMDENLPGVSMFSTQGKDWVSPPGSIYSSSSDSGSSSGDASLSNDNSCIKSVEQLSDKPDVEDGGDCFNSSSLSGDENEEILNSFQLDEMKAKHGVLGDREAVRSTNDLLDAFEDRQKKDLELKVQAGDEVSTMTRLVVMDGSQQGQPPRKGGSRISRGKNAFASSILRQIEMKLDGRDIFENSESTIAEQVDHLLKQASSIDNLCNMYEGWTPWI